MMHLPVASARAAAGMPAGPSTTCMHFLFLAGGRHQVPLSTPHLLQAAASLSGPSALLP